jgi:hypothetical protein
MFRKSDDDDNKAFFTRSAAIEEQEAMAQIAAEDAAKRKLAEDEAYQQQQAKQVQKVGLYYNFFYRLASITTNTLELAGQSIGFIGKILPPLNALVTGMLFIVDLVEALFISRETRNRRAMKITNSIVATGLSTAALVLSFNPATAPLGLTLSAGAMAMSATKDAFFWYKARRDLRNATQTLTAASQQLRHDTHEYVLAKHEPDLVRVKAFNAEIGQLTKKGLTLETKSRYTQLIQQKSQVMATINTALQSHEPLALQRKKVNELAAKVEVLRIERNQKRRSFFSNALSCLGVCLLAVSAMAVAAAVLTNPIGLSIAATTLLGIATAVAIKNNFFSKSAPVVPLETSGAESADDSIHHKALSMSTEYIVNELAAVGHLGAEKTASNDPYAYQALQDETGSKARSTHNFSTEALLKGVNDPVASAKLQPTATERKLKG